MLSLQDIENINEENYIYTHTVRTTIIALIIGKYLKMPTYKLIELGVAALLHDIGMLSIPQELYLLSRQLTKNEKDIINNHPVYSYKILDEHDFSLSIKMAALEHHEREDGTGYPQKFDKYSISQYGKIIAVACSYEAISSKRAYKEAFDLHTGIIRM
jgi:putative nucleotidyltransferase with HDIG domain